MAYTNLLTEIRDHAFIITINRPKALNALNQETVQEIGRAVEEANGNDDVRGIVITGAGEKAFVAGADITEFQTMDEARGKEMAEAGHAVFRSIEQSSKVVIAAVNGFALGGGCELAMACHLRVASHKALFGQPEINLGIIPGYGGTQRLVQLIGKGRALYYLTTAEMIKAEDAEEMGLVNDVVLQVELIDRAVEIVGTIATKAPLAVAKTIACVNAHFESGTDGFAFEVDRFAECMDTDDFTEGVNAFLEKRKAAFTGS